MASATAKDDFTLKATLMNKEENFQEDDERIENQTPSQSFETTLLIIGVQILPPSEDESSRRVILSAGIKGEPPVLSSCVLRELLTGTPIQEILHKLEQALPEIIAAARTREKALALGTKPASQQVIPPQSLPENSVNKSTQITLF